MSLISRLGIVLTFLAVLSTAKGCSQDEFWHASTSCCLPYGGPPSVPPPPKGTKCPSSHYWGANQGCCVPFNPPPEHAPPPQCPEDWDWTSTLRKCTPAPPSPPPPSPSGYPGYGDGGDGYDHGDDHGQGGDWYGGEEDGYGNDRRYHHKRSAYGKARSTPLCPTGLDACPIMGVEGGDYECLDTATELESCGGCVSLGSGQDCTAIPGVWNVGCEQGHCAVYTCAGGFELSMDGKSCVPLE